MLVAPFDEPDALDAIERSGTRPFLNGFRGEPKADFEALAKMIVRAGEIAVAIGKRLEVLELNPVIINDATRRRSIADAGFCCFRSFHHDRHLYSIAIRKMRWRR